MNGRIFDPRTKTWSYPDGSGLVTAEKVVERGLFDTKWRMLNEIGKPDVDTMIADYEMMEKGLV